MSSLEEFAEELIEELRDRKRKLGEAKKRLTELGAQVIIPEMEIEGKKVIGVGIKGDVAYVVEPNGMEKELKKVLRVKEVVLVPVR
ncbi:hypothetical protein EYM_00985 [Ignicoccus islandicus DSM 13165]|uniref:Uncharacterized protein n=1 Tax=Ignicoccus islandicus DSM 13165 TaxID=940295 RepID=A0A0U3ECI2_9CREN|nr:hypothetical protein [Ignicoccus islandicus]ALU12163.1 hypothetical protein EYM_00985 [Ignicoccus islandicus DSM 13165]